MVLHHQSRQQHQNDHDNSISVPILEQSFTRSDGQASSREDLLMALADVDEILVKGWENWNVFSIISYFSDMRRRYKLIIVSFCFFRLR